MLTGILSAVSHEGDCDKTTASNYSFIPQTYGVLSPALKRGDRVECIGVDPVESYVQPI